MSEGTELKLVTFDRTTAKDLLEKLRREIERLESTVEREFSKDHVTNAFWTAWHLHEWLWNAVGEQPKLRSEVLKYRGIEDEGIDDAGTFGAALARRFVPLKICRVIATSSNHVRVILLPENPNDDGLLFSGFDGPEGSSTGQIQNLTVLHPTPTRSVPMVVIMGRPVAATRLLKEVENYWITLIHECGIEQLH